MCVGTWSSGTEFRHCSPAPQKGEVRCLRKACGETQVQRQQRWNGTKKGGEEVEKVKRHNNTYKRQEKTKKEGKIGAKEVVKLGASLGN